MQLVSQSADDTRAIASRFAQRIHTLMPSQKAALVVALRGELGTGKTTFTQGLAVALAIETLPKSPTFLLAKEYPVPNTQYTLWHLDCYRLDGRTELETIDLHHLFEVATNIVVIEWPERIGDGLPRDHIEIHFQHAGGDKRNIRITEQ